MNNDKKAMKLALKALESIQIYGLDTLSGRVDGLDDREWQRAGVNKMTKRARLGITAIKEALAQPEQPTQQEPVTWRNAAIRVGEDLCSVGPFRYYDMTAEQWLDWALSVVTVHSPPTQHGTVTVEYMQREIEAEREACARVAERSESALHCAAAIRARENT